MIANYDDDASLTLSYEEAEPLLQGMFNGLNSLNSEAYPARLYAGDYLKTLFYELDKDGNKEVNKSELKSFLHKMVNIAAKEI